MNNTDWEKLRQILSCGAGSHATIIADGYKLDLYVCYAKRHFKKCNKAIFKVSKNSNHKKTKEVIL